MKMLMTVLVLALASCASNPPMALDQEAAIEELMQADRDFYAASRAHGLDGWVSFHAQDAARVDLFGQVARGPGEIRVIDAPLFADPSMQLRWEPEVAGVFAGGNYGFTKGPFEVVIVGQGGDQVIGRGAYLTLWRRGDDGWRVILDTGAPEPPPAP